MQGPQKNYSLVTAPLSSAHPPAATVQRPAFGKEEFVPRSGLTADLVRFMSSFRFIKAALIR
jgi:hypothetical protein